MNINWQRNQKIFNLHIFFRSGALAILLVVRMSPLEEHLEREASGNSRIEFEVQIIRF